MKALCVKQPWAALIAAGKKTVEVRTWPTAHRGDLLICASLREDRPAMEFHRAPIGTVLRGAAVARVRLVNCRELTGFDLHRALLPADWAPKRPAWAWVLEDARPVEPFAVKGRLGLFEVTL